jgi:site-specific DNA recombinase
VIPGPILEWLGHAVLESDRTERATLDQAIQRLRAQYDRIEARIETMYMDKLDGRVTQQFFDRNSAMWRDQQDALLRKVRDIQTAAPAPIDQAIDILQLTSRASELFFQQPAAEQRRLLQVVVEKATWQHRTLQTTLLEPFEVLRHSNRESCRKEKENAGSGRDLEVWLPGMDSNHIIDRFWIFRNLLISQSHLSRQKHQKQGPGTKSVHTCFTKNSPRS